MYPSRITYIVPLLLAMLAACADDPTTPPGTTPADTAAVMFTFNVRAFAGDKPVVFDSVMTSESGAQYKVSRFRFYACAPSLIDSNGATVAAAFVDTSGKPIRYGVTLVDQENPATMVVRVMAKRGTYKGLAFAIGVPLLDSAAQPLNHGDASTKEYPLDVDADMYWGWNPGYIFLKIEGRSYVLNTWEQFYYHVGDDKRYMRITANGQFSVRGTGTNSATLHVNVNKLFVTPDGQHRPNLVGAIGDRIANNGPQTDVVAGNAQGSGFMTVEP